jgi:hypothetical protein
LPFYTVSIRHSFYQDRLGTNIWKPLKKERCCKRSIEEVREEIEEGIRAICTVETLWRPWEQQQQLQQQQLAAAL